MTSPPDKLFRDKLDQLKMPPPPAAWRRIEAGLQKKRHMPFRLMAAAAIILLLTATFIMWNKEEPIVISNANGTPHTELTEITTPIIPSTSETIIEKNIPPELNPSQKIIKKDGHQKPEVNLDTQGSHHKLLSAGKLTPNAQPPARDSQLTTDDSRLTAAESHPSTDDSRLTTKDPVEEIEQPIAIANQPGLKITYTAKEVNARFLKKKTSDIMQPAENSPSGIQQIVDFAYALKFDETAFGDLRQMKNELLTFSSKNKSKDQ